MDLRTRHSTWAVAAMVLGTTIVFGVVMTMNELADTQKGRGGDKATSFEVAKPEKEPPPPPDEPEPKKQPQESPKPPPPLADLDAQIGSVDIPMPGVDTEGIAGADEAGVGKQKDVVMTDDTVDKAPEPVRQAPMQYPPGAKADGTEGYVVLSILITKTGEVQKVRILEAKPGGVFEQVAKDVIRQWRFEPARYQGEAVKVWARQRIQFNLG
jgi:protein TonB